MFSRAQILNRAGMLRNLQAGHVLVCAPLGYGKSTLLRQYAEEIGVKVHPGEPASGGGSVLLIDDAHHLAPERVMALLRGDPARQRVVLALRHPWYPGLAQLLNAGQVHLLSSEDLSFNEDDLRRMGFPEGRSRVVMQGTLGWPGVARMLAEPLLDVPEFLQEQLAGLSADLRTLAGRLASFGTWQLDMLSSEERQQLRHLLAAGFPVVEQGQALTIPPVMRREVLRGDAPDSEEPSSDLRGFVDEALPVDVRVRRLEHYFVTLKNDDDTNIEAKAAALGAVDVTRLTPVLRDHLGYYLMATAQRDRAEEVLNWQHTLGTASTRTYALLARLAMRRHDMVRAGELLMFARDRVEHPADEARYGAARSLYQITGGDTAAGVQAAREAYQAAQRSGNIELVIVTMHGLSEALQAHGNLAAALDTGQEALRLAQSQGPRFVRLVTGLCAQLSELHKDYGRYPQALDLIREGLTAQQEIDPATPRLYFTRGLVEAEMGAYPEALASFRAATRLYQALGNLNALKMVLTYACYPLYRLGQTAELQAHVQELRSFALAHQEGLEFRAYLPLAEGLLGLARADAESAGAALRQVQPELFGGYDSTLLTVWLLSELKRRGGTFTLQDALLLREVMRSRATGVAYVREFREVLAAATHLLPDEPVFQEVTRFTLQDDAQRPALHLKLTTLGRVRLEVGGHEVRGEGGNRPLYVLAYLLAQRTWRSNEELGEDLFGELKNPLQSASQGVSYLRGLFERVDSSLPAVLSEPKDTRGYLLRPQAHVHFEADFLEVLESFTPDHPDEGMLERMLGGLERFLPQNASEFASEINRQLEARAVEVALALAARYRARGEGQRAMEVVLSALRFVDDPALTDELSPVTSRPAQHLH